MRSGSQAHGPGRSHPVADFAALTFGTVCHEGNGVWGGLAEVVDTCRPDCVEGVVEVVYNGYRFRAVQQSLLQPWGRTVPVRVEALADIQHVDHYSDPTLETRRAKLKKRLGPGRRGPSGSQNSGASRWTGFTPDGWKVVAEHGDRLCDPEDHTHGTVVVENAMTSRRLFYRGVRMGDHWEIQYLAGATGLCMSRAASNKSLPC